MLDKYCFQEYNVVRKRNKVGVNMNRKEMDKLSVGDEIEVRIYNATEEKYEWILTVVNRVMVCSDGGKFAHGGYSSVYAEVNGFTECLTPELTRIYNAEENSL